MAQPFPRLLAALTCLILLCPAAATAKRDSLCDPTLMMGKTDSEPEQLVVVSLLDLQQELRRCTKIGSCDERVLEFGGMRRVDGYVIDTEARDILVFGEGADVGATLHLADFVVALRNTWGKYDEGRRRYSPSCTIDMRPNTINALTSINRNDPNLLKRWDSLCKKPQDAKVFGLPFETRFGAIMVKADYLMKAYIDGGRALPGGGPSVMRRELEAAKKATLAKQPFSMSPVNRFWFKAGANPYLVEDEIARMQRMVIQLCTEEEHIGARGQTIGSGHANPHAAAFARDFTRDFGELAAREWLFADLRALYRWVSLARRLHHDRALDRVNLDASVLLERLVLGDVQHDRELVGRTNVSSWAYEWRDGNVINQGHLQMPSCGGVEINVDVAQQQRGGKALRLLRRRVLARPAGSIVSWKVARYPGSEAIQPTLASVSESEKE